MLKFNIQEYRLFVITDKQEFVLSNHTKGFYTTVIVAWTIKEAVTKALNAIGEPDLVVKIRSESVADINYKDFLPGDFVKALIERIF